MKRYSIFLSLLFFSCALTAAQPDTKCAPLFQSALDQWQSVENTITNNFNNIVNFFGDFFNTAQPTPRFKYDVTLVGFVNFADGIGRHPILFKECLQDNVTMNFLSTRNIDPIIEDQQLQLPRLDPKCKEDIGAVAILTDILADKALNIYKKMPDSLIKVAYTMFESSQIPHNWSAILNKKFDMAVVPDPYLVDVYKKSGVKIPIFVLPLPLMLHEFLKIKPRNTPHKKFVFGVSGAFWNRKNHMRVLEAFAAEFGNRDDVSLKLHGRFGQPEIIKALADRIADYNLTNVELIVKPYDWDEYLEFFKSLDCYVFLSMGEGFSITPREALACGKPCILTYNTAQISICNSGAVRVVPSDILVPAFYDCHDGYYSNYDFDYTRNFLSICNFNGIQNIAFDDEEDSELVFRSTNIGYQFDCTIQDAQSAMRDVYDNYTMYAQAAKLGRSWVKRFLIENLRQKYLNLVKPERVVLGENNIIGDGFLTTNSDALYQKYCYLLGQES